MDDRRLLALTGAVHRADGARLPDRRDGHVYRSRALIATGIGLICIATLLLPLALYATE